MLLAGAEDPLRFLAGMPVGPVAWTDASTASSGASAIFSFKASEVVLQMQLFFFGRLHRRRALRRTQSRKRPFVLNELG